MTDRDPTFWEQVVVRIIDRTVTVAFFAVYFALFRYVVGIAEAWSLGLAIVAALSGRTAT